MPHSPSPVPSTDFSRRHPLRAAGLVLTGLALSPLLTGCKVGSGSGWYLIGLGVTAVAFALFLPRGLWSLIADRLHLRALPIGYHLRSPAVSPGTSAEES